MAKKFNFLFFGNLTKITLKKGEIVVEKFPFPLYFLHLWENCAKRKRLPYIGSTTNGSQNGYRRFDPMHNQRLLKKKVTE